MRWDVISMSGCYASETTGDKNPDPSAIILAGESVLNSTLTPDSWKTFFAPPVGESQIPRMLPGS